MNKKSIVLSVVVGAVIVDNGRVLLLQRNSDESIYPNLWELPSGRKKPLERAGDALIREVREETNLEVIEAVPFYVFDYLIDKPLEIRDSVQINYLTTVADRARVKISQEHQNFAWASREDMPKYGVTDLTAETIKRAFELSNK